MKAIRTALLTLIATTMLMVATPAHAADVEIRLKDGSRWRGDLGDQVALVVREQGVDVPYEGELVKAEKLYIVVRGLIAGQVREKTIFRDDVVTMKSASRGSGDAGSGASTGAATGTSSGAAGSGSGAAARGGDASGNDVPRDASGRELGVFMLPLDGPVGDEFRHDEIKELGRHIDENYGPGQIIVLVINSNGGLVLEADKIIDTIDDLQKRHRVVAWIRKAISAGCSTAMACDEIYFMTEGSAGSVTTLRGSQSVSEEDAQEGIDRLVAVAKESGYSEHIARAMKLNKHMVSYDKDPQTGEVTFYGDLSGEYDLSDDKSNLAFNASNALHCGFSKGTADTEEDLAKLLNLPRWHEIDTYGRQIAARWQSTVKQAKKDVPLLLARLQYKGTGGDQLERLGAVLNTLLELRRWYDRAPQLMIINYNLTKDGLDRQIEEVRRQIALLRRGG